MMVFSFDLGWRLLLVCSCGHRQNMHIVKGHSYRSRPDPSSSIQLSATGRTWITRICAMRLEPPSSLLLPGQFTVDSGGPNNLTQV